RSHGPIQDLLVTDPLGRFSSRGPNTGGRRQRLSFARDFGAFEYRDGYKPLAPQATESRDAMRDPVVQILLGKQALDSPDRTLRNAASQPRQSIHFSPKLLRLAQNTGHHFAE